MRKTPSAHELAESLRVEQLPYAEIPDELWPAVRAFRKYRSDARLHAAYKYLKDAPSAGRRSR
jgi:hypothetical protein